MADFVRTRGHGSSAARTSWEWARLGDAKAGTNDLAISPWRVHL